jgi:hypothetical protein
MKGRGKNECAAVAFGHKEPKMTKKARAKLKLMEKAKQNNQGRTMAPASRRAGKKEGEMRLEGSKAMEGNKKWNEGQH